MSDVLLSTDEDYLEVASWVLIIKDFIIWTEYKGLCRTRSSIQGPSSDIRRAPTCLRHLVWPTSDNLNGGWWFDIMLNHLTFVSIPNCLDLCIWKMGSAEDQFVWRNWSPLLWSCSSRCPKFSAGRYCGTCIGLPATWTDVKKPLVDSCSTFLPKLMPLSSV